MVCSAGRFPDISTFCPFDISPLELFANDDRFLPPFVFFVVFAVVCFRRRRQILVGETRHPGTKHLGSETCRPGAKCPGGETSKRRNVRLAYSI